MQRKRQWKDLALFGGAPAFPTPLHVGRPNLGDRRAFQARIDEIWDRAYLTNNGPLVQEFERRVAAIAGVRHCVAMCNGTQSLEVAARAASLQGEVIVPALTFIGTAQAMSWAGLEVVFADVDAESLTLDPDAVAALITPRTTAVVGVHLFGQSCDSRALEALCQRHDLTLLFDACHALAAEDRRGRPIGGAGDAEVFSFHATKFIHSAEGGALVTNDDRLAERARRLRNFGFVGPDLVEDLGGNAKMSELHAALGLCSLERIDEVLAANRANRRIYEACLRGLPGLRLRLSPPDRAANDQYIVLDVDTATAGVERDTLHKVLQAEGVLARRYFHPGCHRTAPYRTARCGPLEVTNAATGRLLALPTGEAVDEAAIQSIAEILRLTIELPQFLRRHFPDRAA